MLGIGLCFALRRLRFWTGRLPSGSQFSSEAGLGASSLFVRAARFLVLFLLSAARVPAGLLPELLGPESPHIQA